MTGFLSKLKDAGINTAIDDFGTGYSSLSTLRDFPVKVIKIDRSFISSDNLNKNDEIVLKNIIAMADDTYRFFEYNGNILSKGDRSYGAEKEKKRNCWAIRWSYRGN